MFVEHQFNILKRFPKGQKSWESIASHFKFKKPYFVKLCACAILKIK